MPVNPYHADLGFAFKTNCPPPIARRPLEGYMPPKGTAARASSSPSPAASVQTLRTLPVMLQASSAGADTTFAISNTIGFAYIVRSVAAFINFTAGVAAPRVLASVRTTGGSAADATSYNAGQPVLSPYSPEEDIPVATESIISPLWLPIDAAGSRFIARFVNAAAVACEISIVLTITPAAEIDAALAPGAIAPDGTAPNNAQPCTRVFRPLRLNANGEYVPGDAICLDPQCVGGRLIDYQGRDLGPCP